MLGFWAGIVLLAVLVVFSSPCVPGLARPTHLRGRRAASHLIGHFAVLPATPTSVRTITTVSSAAVELQRSVASASVLVLICILIC